MLAWRGVASAWTKQDVTIPASDGVPPAGSLYVPAQNPDNLLDLDLPMPAGAHVTLGGLQVRIPVPTEAASR